MREETEKVFKIGVSDVTVKVTRNMRDNSFLYEATLLGHVDVEFNTSFGSSARWNYGQISESPISLRQACIAFKPSQASALSNLLNPDLALALGELCEKVLEYDAELRKELPQEFTDDLGSVWTKKLATA